MIRYIDNIDIDFDAYFDDYIGVTKTIGKEKEIIKLKFMYPRADYIKTKPLHLSQRIISDSKTELVIILDLIINKEFEAKILEFGKDIEVIEPQWFRNEISEILSLSCSKY